MARLVSSAQHKTELQARSRELARDYSTTFSTPHGKAVLADLVERFYDAALLADDPMKTGHRIGRRDVVAFIRDMATSGQSSREETT